MKDFRREQFVIADGMLKLSDIDDVVVGDPSCTSDQDCAIKDGVKEDILVHCKFPLSSQLLFICVFFYLVLIFMLYVLILN